MKFRISIKLVTLLGLLMLLLPWSAAAQSVVTGGISGTILDPSGAVISGASVTLQNIATGEQQMATSSSSGVYQFSLLKPGQYSITVNQQGFKTAQQKVDVLLGQISSGNVKLELGSGSTTVEVTGQGALLQTEDANITSNFDTNQIQNVPNPGGDITYIAATAPGVAFNTTGLGQGNFSAFGLPGTANLFTINGNDDNDAFLNLNNSGASNLLLGGNELQEVAVVSNAYTGQYGRQAGAQIDYTTKSGANAFHGNAVYYWNGRALNAQDYFLKLGGVPQPFQNNNQWAASLGGPIKKDKAFFFVNTEGIRYVLATANNVFVPTPAFENFALSQVPATATSFYQNIFNIYNGAKGIERAAPQNGSCGGAQNAAHTGGIFAGPGGTYGLPNGTTQCLESFFNSGSNLNKEWLISGRVDYSFSDTDKIFGRVRFDRGFQPTYTDPFTSAFNIESNQPQDEGQLNYTHVFSPNVVNNFIFSDIWYSAIFSSPNLNAALGVFPANLATFDSALTPLGVGSGNGNFIPGLPVIFPQGRSVEQWQLVDDLSVARGNHNFKMGVNFRRDDISDHQASEGSFPGIGTSLLGFSQDQLSPAAASPTLGIDAQQFALHLEQPIAVSSFGLYFQDEYRVSSNLKLTLALRADRNTGGVCQSACTSIPVQPFNLISHDSNIPYSQFVTGGVKPILPSIEKVVFEPRFGLAWSPVGQNTVFRAGIGLFSDLYPGGILDAFTTNFPQVTSFALTTGSLNPAEANSAANLVTQCNSVFQSNFRSGGTVGSFLNNAPAGCALPNITDVTSKLLNPKYIEWNTEIQHTFGSKTVASINYVGNRGYDELIYNPYLNAFAPTAAFPNGFGGLPTTAIDARVANVTQLSNPAVSNYNGVTGSIQEQFAHGFSGRINYTYSHALDDSSNGGRIKYSVFNSVLAQINPFNLQSNYGPADYDLRQNLTASYVWALPIKSQNRLVNTAIGGWTVSGTFFYHTGYPFSFIDSNNTNALSGFNQSGSLVSDTVLAQPIVPLSRSCTVLQNSTQNAGGCVTLADFNQSPTTFATIARNAFRGPGYFNTDFSLRKDFRLTERLGFQIGANFYNVLNHPNFAVPNDTFASGSGVAGAGGNFGVITSTVSGATTPYGGFAGAVADARIVQIMGKVTF